MKDHFCLTLGAYAPLFTLRPIPACEGTLSVAILLSLVRGEAEDCCLRLQSWLFPKGWNSHLARLARYLLHELSKGNHAADIGSIPLPPSFWDRSHVHKHPSSQISLAGSLSILMWLRVTKHHSFLTVEFMRQASRVLWGKCWSKTPSEEGLDLRGIKYCGGEIEC